MEKMKIELSNNYIIKGTSIRKLIELSYKDFYLKRNNLAVFQKNGKYSLKTENFNIYKYFSKMEGEYNKWKNKNYKYNYLFRKSLKKQKIRIKNFTKKNILNKKIDNYIKINKMANQMETYNDVDKKPTIYEIGIFELILIKIRFLENLKI